MKLASTTLSQYGLLGMVGKIGNFKDFTQTLNSV